MQEEGEEKVMAKFINGIDRTAKTGFCGMSKKWNNLGKARSKTSSKSGSVSKADARGKGEAIIGG